MNSLSSASPLTSVENKALYKVVLYLFSLLGWGVNAYGVSSTGVEVTGEERREGQLSWSQWEERQAAGLCWSLSRLLTDNPGRTESWG